MEQPSHVLAGCLDWAVYDRSISELHHAGTRGAWCRLQLQNGYVVLDGGAEQVGWDKEGHLWPTGRPVAAHVKTVNPHLALQ